jgi:hypothetical protein
MDEMGIALTPHAAYASAMPRRAALPAPGKHWRPHERLSMRTSAKLSLTALIAALLLTAAVGTASARRFRVFGEGIRVTWSRLTFEVRMGIPVSCQVTLEGSFHNTRFAEIQKTPGALIGVVTRAAFKTESCTNGRTTAARLPWHISYEGFTGTLPNIATIRLLLREYLLKIERLIGTATECSYGTATDRVIFSAAISSERFINLSPEAGNTSTLLEARNNEGIIRCPGTSELIGGAADGQITQLSSTSRILVTLI